MPVIGNSSPHTNSFYSVHFDSAVHARQCLMIESNRWSIALIDNNEVAAFEELAYEEWNDELFLQSKIAVLKQSLPAVVLIRSDSALLIPEIFRKNKEELMHHFLLRKDGCETAEHKPASFPATVSFFVQKKILDAVRKHFPGALIMHHSLPVFMWMINHPKLKQSSFFIEINGGKLYCYAVKDGTPLLYNSFEVNTKEDAAYFTLFVMEQLEMDPVKQTVYFKANRQDEHRISVCHHFIPAFISVDALNPERKHELELLFPFLINASLCE